MIKNNCDSCKSSNLKLIKKVDEDMISSCLECGFMFVSTKNSVSDYDESYLSIPSYSKFLKNRHFDLIHFFKKNKITRVLEIGSGYGGIGFLCKLEGINYFGVEPDKRRREFLKNISLENIYESHHDINEIFDFILIDNVLEHVLNPKKFLSEISQLLRKDGKLLIIVPNRYDIRRISKKWSIKNFWIPHDHLSYFRKVDIEKMLLDLGYIYHSRFNYGNFVAKILKKIFYIAKYDILALSHIYTKK